MLGIVLGVIAVNLGLLFLRYENELLAWVLPDDEPRNRGKKKRTPAGARI